MITKDKEMLVLDSHHLEAINNKEYEELLVAVNRELGDVVIIESHAL